MTGKILVIVSPAAGRGRARRVQTHLAGYLAQNGVHAEFCESQSPADFRERAAGAAAAGYDCVAALGGDGAFHHLLEGAYGTDIALGFFPAGTGNDIAEALGLPKDPIAAARAFLRLQPRPIDVLQARFAAEHQALFIGAGGMGFDAEAARLANTQFHRWPGVTRYLAGALWALRSSRSFQIEAELETDRGFVRWDGPALLLAAANGPCYGSGFRIAPAARVDDGWMDVTLVEALPWTRVFEALPILLRSGDLRWPEIHRYRARCIRLKAGRPALVHGDGEVLGEAPVEISLLPAAIRVVASPRH